MKAFSKTNQNNALLVAALACVMLAGSISAFAVNPKQVAFVPNAMTFTGQCCSLWNETVSITEPATVVPVIVTWSADVVIDVKSDDDFLVGLSVNGGPCTAFGSREIANLAPNNFFNNFAFNTTHQWVVFPNSGLIKGTNTFALCGGGDHQSGDTISIGESTLTVLK